MAGKSYSHPLVTGALALAVVLSAALLIHLDSHLTFVADDWDLLVVRSGVAPATFLDPFNGNIVLGPALVYRALLAVFGMDSALPFFLVSIAAFLLGAVLLFAYLRPRVGDWLALVGAVLVLFLGAAAEDLLWAFQLGFFSSVAAGLGMLLALDRGSRDGDRAACALLVVSIAFSSVGLAFAAGALADLILTRRRGLSRLYVALVPLALYGLWWAGWGHAAESHFSAENLEHLPGFVFAAAAAGVTSLLGQAASHTGPDSSPLLFQIFLVAGLLGAAYRVRREGHISRGLAIALAIGLAFWVLIGLQQTGGRYPTSSRYQYPSAVFLLLIAAELLRGLRVSRLAILATAAIATVSVAGGIAFLRDQYEDVWHPESDRARATLAGVEIAGAAADPAYVVPILPSPPITTRAYLDAAEEHGSPAFDERELGARPEPDRALADATNAAALGVELAPGAASAPGRGCRIVVGPSGRALTLRPPVRLALESRAARPVELALGRFAAPSVSLGSLPAERRAQLAIPADESARPWSLALRGEGPVRLCPG